MLGVNKQLSLLFLEDQESIRGKVQVVVCTASVLLMCWGPQAQCGCRVYLSALFSRSLVDSASFPTKAMQVPVQSQLLIVLVYVVSSYLCMCQTVPGSGDLKAN